MSQLNGDKSRFGRLRKRKLQLRRTILELRKKLENYATVPTVAVPVLVGITALTIEPAGSGQ